MKQAATYLLATLLCFNAFGHDHGGDGVASVKYQENKGQWGQSLLFFARASGMDVSVGHGKFMLELRSEKDLQLLRDAHHGEIKMPDDMQIHFHNIEFSLIDAARTKPFGSKKATDYVNYFLGDDPSRWIGGVSQYEEINMPSIHPGIDFILSSLNNSVKYEFRIAAGADVSKARFKISGADSIYLFEDQIHIDNSIDELIDDAPIAWQIIEGRKKFIHCVYTLHDDTLGFDLEDYDAAFPLIIDPTLIFASYTGSGTDNWGSTATYDSLGNLYAGGIVVRNGNANMNLYPTSTGAYQTSFQGGGGALGTDIVISKFSDDGSSLIYSTYLGGNNNEIPHSLVVNDNNQLYILGTTSSNNFPVSNNAYDGTFNGGNNIGTAGANGNSNGIGYPNGSDIIVAKFNANGTALVGSTYIGGSGNDGINMSDTLQRAYSDEFRGEIIVDNNDNCYIATSTGSNNFPIVNGFQNTYGGGLTDGVVFKFNSGLTSLLWSTYIGGGNADAAYSLQFDPNLNVFATGGTSSFNFPTTNNVIQSTAPQGSTFGVDGWVAKISNNGQSLLASTYLGTSSYDQSFFVQLDAQGNVYCVGQTLGSYPIGPSWVYSVANSGQFLHKLSNNLQNTVFSTRWGSGNGNINISISAFLVNQCNHIFVAGWGGPLFGAGSGSTTTGLPTTSNAVQTTTDGSDMYFAVFEDSASALLFGSFYGGTGTGGREHVDGGTSRFDKKGIIYQAVCAGCNGTNAGTFPTTSGSHATQKGVISGNTYANCNLGAIKYDLVTLISEADIDGPAEVCVNDTIQFSNVSFGGSIYEWDFGDGNSSTEYEPKHAYSTPGNYDVVLIVYDSVSCVQSDTDTIFLTVIPGPQAVVPNVPKVCPGETVQLNASGGETYSWSPASFLDDSQIADPKAEVDITTTFVVAVSDSCGTDTAHVKVVVFEDETDAISDTALCKGLAGYLRAEGGVSYKWDPGIYLSSSTSSRPLCTPDTSTQYHVTIVDSNQCERIYPVTVYVEGFVPQIETWGDTSICAGERVLLNARGSDNYQWQPSTWILDPRLPQTPAYPEESITYTVITFNSCGYSYDSVQIEVESVEVTAFADTAVCGGDSVFLGATGSLVYKWTGPEFERPNYNQFPAILPTESSWYKVTGSNFQKCEKEDSLFVTVHPKPWIDLQTNRDTITGLFNVKLVAQSSGQHRWISDGYIPCSTCDTIEVYPQTRTEYFIEVLDSNLCKVSDSILVEPISKIFTPNTFSPNSDNINELFIVQGHNITEYEISIRNRWGQEVFRSQEMTKHWNGTYFNNGNPSPEGVYVFEIKYTILPEEELFKVGTINLLR